MWPHVPVTSVLWPSCKQETGLWDFLITNSDQAQWLTLSQRDKAESDRVRHPASSYDLDFSICVHTGMSTGIYLCNQHTCACVCANTHTHHYLHTYIQSHISLKFEFNEWEQRHCPLSCHWNNTPFGLWSVATYENQVSSIHLLVLDHIKRWHKLWIPSVTWGSK